MQLVFHPCELQRVEIPESQCPITAKLLRENPDVMKAMSDKFDEYMIEQVTKSKDGSTGQD